MIWAGKLLVVTYKSSVNVRCCRWKHFVFLQTSICTYYCPLICCFNEKNKVQTHMFPHILQGFSDTCWSFSWNDLRISPKFLTACKWWILTHVVPPWSAELQFVIQTWPFSLCQAGKVEYLIERIWFHSSISIWKFSLRYFPVLNIFLKTLNYKKQGHFAKIFTNDLLIQRLNKIQNPSE